MEVSLWLLIALPYKVFMIIPGWCKDHLGNKLTVNLIINSKYFSSLIYLLISIYLSIFLYLLILKYLFYSHLPPNLNFSIYLSLHLYTSRYHSFSLSIYQSLYLSIFESICLSICLFIWSIFVLMSKFVCLHTEQNKGTSSHNLLIQR